MPDWPAVRSALVEGLGRSQQIDAVIIDSLTEGDSEIVR